MKTLISVIVIAVISIGLGLATAPKQTVTKEPWVYCVDVGSAEQPRVEEAFGSILGLRNPDGTPRPATGVEIEAAIFNWVEGSTHDYERRKNMSAFTPPPFGSAKNYKLTSPTPSPKK
jgi:hypothetical protein